MKFKTLLTLIICGASTVVLSQTDPVSKANEAFRSQDYCTAAQMCQKAYTKITRKSKGALRTKGDMAFKTGECYRFTENPKDATDWYERAIILNYQETNPEVFLNNADMYLIMGNSEKAKTNYQEFIKLVPGDQRGLNGLASIKEKLDAKPTRFKVTNQSKINSSGWDMAPAFGDRKMVQMTYSRTKSTAGGTDPRSCEPFFDLWVTELDKNGNWMEPQPIVGDGINTTDNEGTVAFSNRGKKMFFTRCPMEKKQNLGCDIWVSDLKGKAWGEPSKIVLKTNDSISVGHPCVSDDGKTLIFASDMPGGFGGKDLWISTYDKRSDSWATPVNLGAGINTSGDELFPSFSLEGEDLIYASNGLPGFGGLDIFKAKKAGDNKWENPTNYGEPINSRWNDYSLAEHDNRHGYFTSERTGNITEYKADIWGYELPPFVYDLTVVVGELGDQSRKKRIAGVPVTITTKDGQKFTGTTTKDGKVFWDKKADGSRFINENETYTIALGTIKGFQENTKTETFTTIGLDQNQNFYIEMQMVPERSFTLPEIRYPLDQWTLLVDSTINSKDSLEYVYNLLTEFPGMVLELNSHTDSRGSDKYNQTLSENRAKACYKYLVEEKGIDPRRVIPIGRGESIPQTIVVNGKEVKLTEAYINKFKGDKVEYEHLNQLNRRTDARVVTMNFDPNTAPAANPNYLIFKKPRR